MKCIILFAIVFSTISFIGVNVIKAQSETSNPEENVQPVLPQDDTELTPEEPIQQISSPQFFSEENAQSFIKGVGVGAALGVIVGGTLVWFFKKKLS